MTPFEIEVLMHYLTRPGDYRDGDFSAPILPGTMQAFVDEGLMTYEPGSGGRCFDLTERGIVYCESLQRVPLPKQQWVTVWPNTAGEK